METISGVLQRINYYNQDNGYTVAILELDYKDKNIAMKKAKIVGNTIDFNFSFPHSNEKRFAMSKVSSVI